MISRNRGRRALRHYVSGLLPLALAMGLSLPQQLQADATGLGTAPLKPDVPYVFVVHQGRSVKVVRNIEKSFAAGMDIRATLMQTVGSCPPFCLQPMQLEQPVETVGEAEIVDFMLSALRDNTGVLVDVRSPRQHNLSTIPGSINLFMRDLIRAHDENTMDKVLESLGAKTREVPGWFMQQLETYGLVGNGLQAGKWDFTEAKDLIIWDLGATSAVPARAIDILLAAGYPVSKIKWYRGGMAAWQYWGFSTVGTLRRR